MALEMLSDRIAVREIKKPVVSDGGIYIGEQEDDGLVKEIVQGEILAVGPGLVNSKGKLEWMWGLKPGDIIGYSPVCSHTQVIDGEEVTIIRRDAIVGIME